MAEVIEAEFEKKIEECVLEMAFMQHGQQRWEDERKTPLNHRLHS